VGELLGASVPDYHLYIFSAGHYLIPLMDSAAMRTTVATWKAVAHIAWTTKGPLPTLSTVAATAAVASR